MCVGDEGVGEREEEKGGEGTRRGGTDKDDDTDNDPDGTGGFRAQAWFLVSTCPSVEYVSVW